MSLSQHDKFLTWIDKQIDYARNRNIPIGHISLSKSNLTKLYEALKEYHFMLYDEEISDAYIDNYRGYDIRVNNDLPDNIILVSG